MPSLQSYLEQAHALVNKPAGQFKQEDTARVQSLLALADAVGRNEARALDASVNGGKRKGDPFAGEVSSPEFREYLRGEKRDWSSGGGAYPGSGSGYFSPLGFYSTVIAMLKQLDNLFDPTVDELASAVGYNQCMESWTSVAHRQSRE